MSSDGLGLLVCEDDLLELLETLNAAIKSVFEGLIVTHKILLGCSYSLPESADDAFDSLDGKDYVVVEALDVP